MAYGPTSVGICPVAEVQEQEPQDPWEVQEDAEQEQQLAQAENHMEACEDFKQQALLHHWRQQNLAAQLAQQEASQQPLAQRPDGARRCHDGGAPRRPWPHNSLRLPDEWRPGQVVRVEVLTS